MAKQKLVKRNTFENIFVGGMHADRDPLQQDNKTYRYSLNGRLLFNQAANYAWVNENGLKFSFSLPDGYRPIGATEISGNTFPVGSSPDYTANGKLVILSTNEVYSEIGLLTLDTDENGNYTTIFNDQFDPNGMRFNFSFSYPARMWAVIESPSKQRVYWVNAHDEKFTFNVVAGLASNNPEFINGDYQPLVSGFYPWFYSIQQSQWYTDYGMGRIKFNERLGTVASPAGALKTGVFQYTYRLGTREGYWTPFYPLTRHIMLTDIDLTTISNSHDYYMTNSNVTTPYAIELFITGLDTRYYYLQVAYVYSIDQDATVESNVFYNQRINPLSGTTITITHTDHSGIPINIDEYNVYPVFTYADKDLVEKDQRMWFCNFKTYGDFKIDISNISIVPKIRLFDGDDLGAQLTPPLTDTSIVSGTPVVVQVESYIDKFGAAVYEDYNIIGDFENYKGMQFEHLFTGYWRGETYPFGIVWYDRKGIPFYTQNLVDYTFPQQYDAVQYLLTDQGFGYNQLRAMGILLSGIAVDDAFLYDELGNLRVSGFSIVRCKRKPKILYQAVIADTVFSGKDGENNRTRPLPMPSEYFTGFFAQNSIEYDTNYGRDGSNKYGDRPATYLLHSPEISFGFDVYGQTGQDGLQPSDVLKIVSQNQSAFNDVGYCPGDPDLIELYGGVPKYYFYTKQYKTFSNIVSTYAMGTESRIETINLIDFSNDPTQDNLFIVKGYDPESLILEFWGNAVVHFNDGSCTCDAEFESLCCRGAQLMKVKDFNQVITFDDPNRDTYYLVNYVAASTQYYNDFNSDSISSRKYIGTGHFQPINATVLAQVKSPIDNKYHFNNIEVWGGDCYVGFWDFLRLYPRYGGDCNTLCNESAANVYRGYAVGMVVPIESNLNFAMRKGRSFASVAVETENNACDDPADTTGTGCNPNQPEEFNLNSVLLQQENTQFFPGLPSDIDVSITQFPNRWVYTPIKFYGELTDNYRRVLANNFGDVIGLYGDIQGGILWNNQIYSYQLRGWGRLRINDRSIITTQNEEATQTGAGKTYDGIDYFSHNYGTQDIFSLVQTERGMYWWDNINHALMRYGGAGQEIISDTKEQHDFTNFISNFYDEKLRSASPFKFRFVSAVYDRLNSEVIFVFADNADRPSLTDSAISIVFNENIDSFTTFESFSPVFIVSFREWVFSADNSNINNLYRHGAGDKGNYYGVVHDSIITPVINPLNDYDKKIDTLTMNINHNAALSITEINFISETQNYSLLSFQTYPKAIFRFDQTTMPIPLAPDGARLTGKHAQIRFTFTNVNKTVFKFSNLLSDFRINKFTR